MYGRPDLGICLPMRYSFMKVGPSSSNTTCPYQHTLFDLGLLCIKTGGNASCSNLNKLSIALNVYSLGRPRVNIS